MKKKLAVHRASLLRETKKKEENNKLEEAQDCQANDEKKLNTNIPRSPQNFIPVKNDEKHTQQSNLSLVNPNNSGQVTRSKLSRRSKFSSLKRSNERLAQSDINSHEEMGKRNGTVNDNVSPHDSNGSQYSIYDKVDPLTSQRKNPHSTNNGLRNEENFGKEQSHSEYGKSEPQQKKVLNNFGREHIRDSLEEVENTFANRYPQKHNESTHIAVKNNRQAQQHVTESLSEVLATSNRNKYLKKKGGAFSFKAPEETREESPQKETLQLENQPSKSQVEQPIIQEPEFLTYAEIRRRNMGGGSSAAAASAPFANDFSWNNIQ